MKQLDPQALYEPLKADRLRYCCALLALQQGGNEAFASDGENCYALVHQYPYGTFAFFTDYDPVFFKQVLRRYPTLDLCIDLPPGKTPSVERMRGLKPYPEPWEFFAYEGEVPAAPVDPHIRLLAKLEEEERALLGPFAVNPLELGKPGMVAFAWFEGESPAACLLCSPEVEDIWDVSGTYRLPQHSKASFDAKLLYAYLQYVRKLGCIPQISDTRDLEPAAAPSAGFVPCSIRYAFKYQKPVIFS